MLVKPVGRELRVRCDAVGGGAELLFSAFTAAGSNDGMMTECRLRPSKRTKYDERLNPHARLVEMRLT
jgi:hypothetical protein